MGNCERTYLTKVRDSAVADVVVTTFNRIECLKKSLQSIREHTACNYQLIVIDVGSKDGTREYLLREWADKATLIFEQRRFSYAQSCNNGMRYGRAKYIAMINDDCEATPGWLDNAVNAMEKDPTIGHGAHVVLRADRNHIMSAGANVNRGGCTTIPFMDFEWEKPEQRAKVQNPENYGYSRNFAYAGFGVYRRDLLEKLGYLPEFPVVIYFDDTDYGMKVNSLGYDVRLIPDSVIVHFMVHENREFHPLSANIGHLCFNSRWSEFLNNNDGYRGGEPRPYLNGRKGLIYDGEPYKPLGFAVEGRPKGLNEVEHTWQI